MSKDASTTVEEIVGKIKMKDGTTRSFRIGTDFGWSQWGECENNLSKSTPVIEAMVAGLNAEIEIVSDSDEDDEYEPDEGPEEGDEDTFLDFDPDVTYKIVRYIEGAENKVIETGLTLAQAKAHCSSPSTSGPGWFDGHVKETR